MEDKNHWYDGRFYDLIIAPNQDRLFSQIRKLIEPDSDVIDVGCGTGRFAFTVADKCKSVLGIDLSKRNIERAQQTLLKKQDKRITFLHNNVSEIIENGKKHFDYAVLTYVIHEVDEDERIKLLYEILEIADKIIIGDYLVPRPNGFWNILNNIVEFAAGRQHYNNFKSFVEKHGITGLSLEGGLPVIHELKNTPLTSHIAVISKMGK